MKIAIITGITGQDGAYLSDLLLKKGYKVIGLLRSEESINTKKLDFLGITSKIIFSVCNLLDLANIINTLNVNIQTPIKKVDD